MRPGLGAYPSAWPGYAGEKAVGFLFNLPTAFIEQPIDARPLVDELRGAVSLLSLSINPFKPEAPAAAAAHRTEAVSCDPPRG
jgi:hypothetical protein